MLSAPTRSAKFLYHRWFKLPPNTRRLSLVLSLGLILIFSFKLIILPHQSGDRSNRFVPAQQLVSEALIEQVISENYLNLDGSPLDRSAVEAFKFSGNHELDFYIFNFKTSNLCGISGCLYTVYTQNGFRVLDLFLQPNLPEQIQLFETRRQPSSDHPCLIVHQPDPLADLQHPATFLSTRYCYHPTHAKFTAQVQYQQQI